MSWDRVKEIVGAALELDPDARAAFLAQACQGDPELEREARSLLDADTSTGFLKLDRSTAAPAPPETIGPYRVARELGRGGMGVVYLADRDDGQFQQQVAIKVIKRGMDTDLVLRRFLNERQILARLRHPHITSLLDGGMTADGLPYFVMERVDGVPLDRYCQGFSIPRRLELFLQVSSAVEYAHANLILHRDIKAGNVLVGPDGIPKLLDFGIAKLLEGDESAGRTVTGLRAFTPQAASPEQVRGEPLTTATDVYSLGALLAKLLDGKPPGDLLNIVQKAMQSEPARRYTSAAELAADVRRYLAGQPVIARPDSLGYRARRFIARNQRGIAIAAVVVIALGAAVAYALTAAAREQRRFAQVRGLAHSVIFEMNDAITGVPGATAARAILVQRAVQYLDALAAEAGSNPDLLRELAQGYEKLGTLQGDRSTAHTGDIDGAFTNLKKSAQLYQRLQDRDGFSRVASRLSLVEISRGHMKEGVDWGRQSGNDKDLGYALLQAGDLKGALEAMQRNTTKMESAQPTLENRRALASALKYLGQIQGRSHLFPQAISSFQQSLAIDKALLAENPTSLPEKINLSIDYENFARMNFFRGQLDAGIQFLRDALQLDEEAVAADPNNDRPLNSVKIVCSLLAEYLAKKGDGQQALVYARRTLAIAQQMQARHPHARSEADIADGYLVLGGAYEAAHDHSAARQYWQQAFQILDGMRRRHELTIDDRHDLTTVEQLLKK